MSITGHASGASLKFALFSEHVLAYLLLLPVAVANLDLDAHERHAAARRGCSRLAIFKAVLGLIEVAGHHGVAIEGTSTLTYYEPTANWVIMVALLVHRRGAARARQAAAVDAARRARC